jgi:hypothetical protein
MSEGNSGPSPGLSASARDGMGGGSSGAGGGENSKHALAGGPHSPGEGMTGVAAGNVFKESSLGGNFGDNFDKAIAQHTGVNVEGLTGLAGQDATLVKIDPPPALAQDVLHKQGQGVVFRAGGG